MGKLTKLTALLVLLPAVIFAAGDTGASVLGERTGGRAIAMGGAYTAAGDDVESMNYNPAGVAFIQKRQAELAWNTEFPDTSVFYAAYAQPLETFIVEGLTGISIVYRSIPTISNPDALDPAINYYDAVVTGTYATSLWQFLKTDISKDIYAGLSAKIATEQMGPYNGTYLAFDAGTVVSLADTGLKLGLSILNAGVQLSATRSDVNETLSKSPLPLTLRAGAAYKIKIDEKNNTQFSADYIQDFYDYSRFAVGLEHNLINIIFLRMGYNMAVDSRNPAVLSAGAGIYVTATTPVEITVGLNYTYRLYMISWFNSPDSLHAISGVFKF
jgi:hypothetical protein